MIAVLLVAAKLYVSFVSINSKSVIKTFDPTLYFGAGVDGSDEAEVKRTYRYNNLAAMKSDGLRSLTYRLRTELGCEAWHWNPDGVWSDAAHRQGYWTGNARPGAPIKLTWGYRLPRRGNTFDQANNDGYSRLADGDISSYWKSNPYLDAAYSAKDGLPPQWVVVDLKHSTEVNAMRLRWANPYATSFRVEYWKGKENFEQSEDPKGKWLAFPHGIKSSGHGGDQVLFFGGAQKARFVRILLLSSSHTSEPSSSPDRRDRMGFAIRELELGTEKHGGIVDAIHHRPDKTQTAIYTSSTDPWHRPEDIDRSTVQPGFDMVFGSGLAGNRPALVPVAVLYDTPENAAAELRWLEARRYPLRGIEMGEEPDGQFVDAEHYTNLYLQVARRLKRIDPRIRLGGPCFQTTTCDYCGWPDHRPKSWMRRFTDEIARRKMSRYFNFFSFEWYPFDKPFGDSAADLLSNSKQITNAIARMKLGGLTTKIPWLLTEFGYSAFPGPDEVKMPAALLDLDTEGTFLQLGGSGAYLYGYEPGDLATQFKGQWGNEINWLVDAKGDATYPTASHWAAKMMTGAWCMPRGGLHYLVASSSTEPLVRIFTVKRPDGTLASLVLNIDPTHERTVTLKVDGRAVAAGRTVQFGPQQYSWHDDGKNGKPVRSLPPVKGAFTGAVTLPPYSATVVLL